MGLDAGEPVVAVLDGTRSPGTCRLVPLLAGWADLDEREGAAGIEPGHPVLVDPEFRIDPVLARFLSRSRFTSRAEGTREAHAEDYRLFLSGSTAEPSGELSFPGE